MTSIIEHLKDAVMASTQLELHYHTTGDLNVTMDTASMPCAFAVLLDNGEVDDTNGTLRERVSVAIDFCDIGDAEAQSYHNEDIIQQCKERAFNFINSLRLNDKIRLVRVNSTARTYEQFDSLLTGYAVNITVEEIDGVTSCK